MLPRSIDAGPVVLRARDPAEAEAHLASVQANAAELAPWLDWDGPPTIERARRFLTDAAHDFELGGAFSYGMWERATGELVGGCLVALPAHDVATLASWVQLDRRRRGYAAAAIRTLTVTAFEALDEVERFEMHVDTANLVASELPRSLGYLLERVERRTAHGPADSGLTQIWVLTRPR